MTSCHLNKCFTRQRLQAQADSVSTPQFNLAGEIEPVTRLASDMHIQMLSNSKIFESPISGASQTVLTQGSRWGMNLSSKNLQDDKTRVLEALVAVLDEVAG